MRGLVLEGGGALGAYQVGVIKALDEKGLTFDGVVGTSIGSINGALYIQGGSALLEKLWKNIDIREIFDDADLMDLMANFNVPYVLENKDRLRQIIDQGGIEIDGFFNLINTNLDEDKIRQSPVDYGLVTYSITDREGLRLYKEDIARGHMGDFIVASCYLPGFKREEIMGKKYFDGAIVDNLPFKMLADKGYTDLYLVKIGGTGLVRDIPKDKAYKLIKPREKMFNSWDYSQETIRQRIDRGYRDAKVFLGDYKGMAYTFDMDLKAMKKRFFPKGKKIPALAKLVNLPPLEGREMFFMYILPAIGRLFGPKPYSSDEIFLLVLEAYLKDRSYDKDRLYDQSIFDEISFDEPRLRFAKSKTLYEIAKLIFT